MIASITSEPPPANGYSSSVSPTGGTPHVADVFMTICEQIGDFSFIFSAAERRDSPGQRWRPAAGDLPSVLSWYSSGPGQRGEVTPDGLWLHDVAVIEPSPQLHDTYNNFLSTIFPSVDDVTTLDHIRHILPLAGFVGSQNYIMTTNGLFFPQRPLPASSPEHHITILVSTGVSWTFGCPGLVIVSVGGSQVSYEPGVFVGNCRQLPQTSVKLS